MATMAIMIGNTNPAKADREKERHMFQGRQLPAPQISLKYRIMQKDSISCIL